MMHPKIPDIKGIVLELLLLEVGYLDVLRMRIYESMDQIFSWRSLREEVSITRWVFRPDARSLDA